MKKRIILLLGILFCANFIFAQDLLTADTAELKTNDTSLVWVSVNSGYTLLTTVFFEINTVNSSNFQGKFNIYKGFGTNNSEKSIVTASDDKTFTQTAQDNSTAYYFDISNWNYPYIGLQTITSNDAQTITIKPKVKTTRLR